MHVLSAKELVSLLLTLDPSERLTAQQALAHPWLVCNFVRCITIVIDYYLFV